MADSFSHLSLVDVCAGCCSDPCVGWTLLWILNNLAQLLCLFSESKSQSQPIPGIWPDDPAQPLSVVLSEVSRNIRSLKLQSTDVVARSLGDFEQKDLRARANRRRRQRRPVQGACQHSACEVSCIVSNFLPPRVFWDSSFTLQGNLERSGSSSMLDGIRMPPPGSPYIPWVMLSCCLLMLTCTLVFLRVRAI